MTEPTPNTPRGNHLAAFVVLLLVAFVWFHPALFVQPVGEALTYVGIDCFTYHCVFAYGDSVGEVPLTLLSATENAIYGENITPRMILNILLLVAGTWLLGMIVIRLGGRALAGYLSMAVFLTLPVHHEHWYWLSARGQLVAGFLTLLALYLWSLRSHWWRFPAVLMAWFAYFIAYSGGAFWLIVPLIALLKQPAGDRRPGRALLSTWPAWVTLALTGALCHVFDLELLKHDDPLAVLNGLLHFNVFDSAQGIAWTVATALVHATLALGLLRVLLDRNKQPGWWRGVVLAGMWLLAVLPLLLEKQFDSELAFLPSATVAVGLGLIGDSLWQTRRLRWVAVAIVGLVVLGGAWQLRAIGGDWQRAGRLSAQVKAEVTRLEPIITENMRRVSKALEKSDEMEPGSTPGAFSVGLDVYNLPYRIGSAIALDDTAHLVAFKLENGKIAYLSNGGPLNAEKLLSMSLEPVHGSSEYIWRDGPGRLLRLAWSESRPSDFSLGFWGCAGQVRLKALVFESAGGHTQRIADFRRWRIEGAARFSDANTLTIDDGWVRLTPPAAHAPKLDQVMSLTMDLDRPEGEKACTLKLMARDPQSPQGMDAREIKKRIEGKLDWRLSGLDAGLKTWWQHLALVDYPPAEIERAAGEGDMQILSLSLSMPGRIEAIQFDARVTPAENQPFIEAELWGLPEGGGRPIGLLPRTIKLLRNQTASEVTVPLPRDTPPLTAILLFYPTAEGSVSIARIRLLRPFVWPALSVD